MRRGETIFEVNPHLLEEVERGIASEGSNLSGVSARCTWDPVGDWTDESDTPRISELGEDPEYLMEVYFLKALFNNVSSSKNLSCMSVCAITVFDKV